MKLLAPLSVVWQSRNTRKLFLRIFRIAVMTVSGTLIPLTDVRATTVYVDATHGFNSLDGSTNVVISAIQGPLRSINTAVSEATSGSTVSVAAGYYTELTGATSVIWDVSIKMLNFAPQGCVRMENDFSTLGDGIPDWWKILNGLSITDPSVAGSASVNPWAHGLTNLQVYLNPSVLLGNNYSTLNDGIPDWWKILNGYSLLDPTVSAAFGNLIGWWNLDEGTGTNIYDSSFHALNGFLAGSPLPQWTNGVSSNALWFCGSNFVQVAAAPLLSPTNALTLLAWVQISTNVTVSGAVVSKWTTNASPIFGSYALGFTNNQITFGLSITGTVVSLVGATTNADGAWHLIAGAYDGTQMTVYLDGAVDASAAVTGTVDVVSAPLLIGPVAGTINDVHLYSRALSADELANYSTLADGIPDWWKVAYGFSITDPTVSTNSPQGDGISNLLAYQYGLDPWVTQSSYVMINGGVDYATNDLATIDPSLSPFPLLLVSLYSNMASATVLSNAVDSYLLTESATTNVTFYFQYETASTNAVGNEFAETVSVDLDPPVVTFSPGNGGTNDLSNPLIQIGYYDPFGADTNATPSGLNLSTLTITLDGINVTTNFYIFPTMAIGDASGAWVGWHTNIVALADNAGNWTFATNVFYATGATNTVAPTLSNCNLATAGVVAPDSGLMWVQVQPSQTNNVTVTVSVNGATPVSLTIVGHTAGGFVSVDPSLTNLVVLSVTGTNGGVSATSALANTVSPPPAGFQCTLISPGLDVFANGQSQTVVVAVSTGDGMPAVTNVTINGVGTAASGGQYTTVTPVPVATDGSSTPVTVVVCFTDSSCVTVPLAVLEGYEIVQMQTLFSQPAWEFQYGSGFDCGDGWALDAAGGDETLYSFTAPPGCETNCTLTGGLDVSCPPCYICTDTPSDSLLGGYWTNNITGGNVVLPSTFGLTFGNDELVNEWDNYNESNTPPSGVKDIVQDEYPAESNSITFNSPRQYTQPDGSPTTVLLTFEGMSYTVGPGDVMNLSNVTFTLPGATVDPDFILVNTNSVSYLVTLCGGMPYTINGSCFTWPAATTWSAISTQYWGSDSNNFTVITDTYDGDILSFSGFHNASASFDNMALRPGIGSSRSASCTAIIAGNVSLVCSQLTSFAGGEATVSIAEGQTMGSVTVTITGITQSHDEGDVVLLAVDESGVVLARKPVTVVMPCRLQETKASGPQLQPFTYSYQGEGVSDEWLSWGYNVRIQVLDQFGKALGLSYKGAPVREHVAATGGAVFDGVIGSLDVNGQCNDWVASNAPIYPYITVTGACPDNAGTGCVPTGEAKAWLSSNPGPSPMSVGTWTVFQQTPVDHQQTVIIDGNPLSPIYDRKCAITPYNPSTLPSMGPLQLQPGNFSNSCR